MNGAHKDTEGEKVDACQVEKEMNTLMFYREKDREKTAYRKGGNKVIYEREQSRE